MNPVIRKSILSLYAACLLLTACSEDFDLTTAFKTGLCTVVVSSGEPLYLMEDDGLLLNPVTELDSTVYLPGNRYLVTYILMDTMSSVYSGNSSLKARILDMQYVMIKDALVRSDTLSATGDDAVNFLQDPWFGGAYLNVNFSLRYNDEDIKHSVWLICDSTIEEQGSTNMYLSFLHNANGDSPAKTTVSLISFNYYYLPQFAETDSLFIRVKEWMSDSSTLYTTYRIANEQSQE